MCFNMNRHEPAAVSFSVEDWTPSPIAGVHRIRLERAGAESGWTTSIVKYDPLSKFHQHSHPNGEELFILDGVFSDENGDYPKGTYIRNPDPSPHSPFSKEGCILLVRLCQMNHNQLQKVIIKPNSRPWILSERGYHFKLLYQDSYETVEIQKHIAYTPFLIDSGDMVILQGNISMDGQILPPFSWARSPNSKEFQATSPTDAVILVKKGHLE